MLNVMRSAVLQFHSIPLGELPPPPPRDCFGRDELIEKVIGFAENLEPFALIGAGGIGKTSIALTALHHDRIIQRFGENRRFIRCDQFPASHNHLLSRISEVIGAGVQNPKDLTPLRPLLSSKEVLIILDNAESILDPKGPDAEKIYSVVDELCRFKKVCLCITSRITTVPPRCRRPEIPPLSKDAAGDIFYGIYGDGRRSSIIDDLLERLDFHALSITLLATTAAHNSWSHNRLAKEWDTKRAQVLQADYNKSLAATIELSLGSPTFRSLGPKARDLLGVVAFFPQGINEENLDWLFPTITDRENIFDKFCLLSLTYRSNTFITALAPIRDYLGPRDPQSSPLLCATRDHYLTRLSVNVHPTKPGFAESAWILPEDVNVEHLLDVFTSVDPKNDHISDACRNFFNHLVWNKPRPTLLGSKIEALSDDRPSKPAYLYELARLLGQVGNYTEQKRLLTLTLKLHRRRGDDARVAHTLQDLSGVNRLLGLHQEGMQHAEEALEIYERIDDKFGLMWCLDKLAWLLLGDEKLDAAENAASRAIDICSTVEGGQEFILGDLHRVLGYIHRNRGNEKKAIHQFETALRMITPFNWHNEIFWNRFALAQSFDNGGQFDDAHAQIELAKPHACNDEYKLGRAMQMQADVWYRQRRLEDAKSGALRALQIYERSGAEQDVGLCRELLQKIERAVENRSTRFQGISGNKTSPSFC